MNIQQLLYVVEVKKWRSFSVAAKNNYVSQSRISRAIIDLENELGFNIFIRNSRGVLSITSEGVQFLERANELVSQYENFKYMYSKDFKRLKIRTVNINCVKTAYNKFVQDTLSKNDLLSTIEIGTTFEVFESILRNDCDLGIVVMVADLKHEWEDYLSKTGLEYIHIRNLISYFIISKNDILANRNSINFDDLVDYVFVQLSQPINSILDYHDYVFQSLGGNKIKKFIYVYDKDLAYSIVANNKAFYTEADAYINYDKFHQLNLTCKKHKKEHLYNLGYIKKKNRNLSDEAEHFIDILKR